jgi:hypothetical protein
VITEAGATRRGSHVTNSARNGSGPGAYTVTFDRNVSNCAYSATLGDENVMIGHIGVARTPDTPTSVNVATFNSANTFADSEFQLVVVC